MQVSKYNLWVENYPDKGENLLFNTRTQALLTVDDRLKAALRGLPRNKEEITSPVLRKNLAALKENGIIVESQSHEEILTEDFFRQLKEESYRMPFEVTILTTLNCNFGCTYCFEESVKDDVFMDQYTANLTVEWIKNRAKERNYQKIFAVYYGGEPLMNILPIYDISWHLTQWAQKEGREFRFGIITNGSLLTSDLIDKLLPVGLSEIRISIDGDRVHHNRNRPFRDGRDSFDVIIENIKQVIDKVAVGIAGNFDFENAPSIPYLLDYLREEGLLYKFSQVDFAPIMPRLGSRAHPGNIELGHCLHYFAKEGIMGEVLKIKRELLARDLPFHNGFAINSCGLFLPDGAIAIDPKGKLYKCNSLIGYPEFSVGDIRHNHFNENFAEFGDLSPWKKCAADCPYVPMCQGGCRFFAYLEHQDFSSLCCKRDYFDAIGPELIKLEYEKLQKQPAEPLPAGATGERGG